MHQTERNASDTAACLETDSGDGPVLLCCSLLVIDLTNLSKNWGGGYYS